MAVFFEGNEYRVLPEVERRSCEACDFVTPMTEGGCKKHPEYENMCSAMKRHTGIYCTDEGVVFVSPANIDKHTAAQVAHRLGA